MQKCKQIVYSLTLPKWRYRCFFLIWIWHELEDWNLWLATEKAPFLPEVLLISKSLYITPSSVATDEKPNQTNLRQKEVYGGFITSCNWKLQIWRGMARLSLTSSRSQTMKISAVRVCKIKAAILEKKVPKDPPNLQINLPKSFGDLWTAHESRKHQISQCKATGERLKMLNNFDCCSPQGRQSLDVESYSKYIQRLKGKYAYNERNYVKTQSRNGDYKKQIEILEL